MMSNKLILIDGNSILNRAFYGIPDLTNVKGIHTNAVYGFLNIMFKILEEENPTHLCVAFDVKAPTFRHKIYKEYKGTRKPMPQELKEQLPLIKDVLSSMQIKMVEKAGLEADDILGTLAKKAQADGFEITLVSGDRDLLQIADKHIKISIPKTKGQRTVTEEYYPQDVMEKYQVTPEAFIDLKAFMGDTADNIPGVPKIGEKTATKLVASYGSLDGVYAHIDEIAQSAVKSSLIEYEEQARLSKTLATIKTDCDFSLHTDEFMIKDFYTKEFFKIATELELKNILKRFPQESDKTVCEQRHMDFEKITDYSECKKAFLTAGAAQYCTFQCYFDSASDLIALGLTDTEERGFLCIVNEELSKDMILQEIRNLALSVTLVTFDAKKQYGILPYQGCKKLSDLLIAAYLCNPLKNDYDEETLIREYLSVSLPSYRDIFIKDKPEDVLKEKTGEFLEFAGSHLCAFHTAYPVIESALCASGMKQLFEAVEMPLSDVLFGMEQEGVKVSLTSLKEYSASLDARISQLSDAIYRVAGETFNIQSPKQLGEILFGKMGLPGGKKTKTGYSTAADVLEKLSDQYPVVSDILEYRGLTKLKSTYAEGLQGCIASDGRIHTTFQQTVTATGRISSTEPNLQNIPMRMELGRKIRKAFIPKDGYVFLDADYSQIELRILAHLSGDEQLIDAYRQDADIHRITASKVFHTPFEEVTDLQRRNAKAVNFGIVYGISSFGLSQGLSITRKEAAHYIDEYFTSYPKVKEFLDAQVNEAKELGYTTTMFSRRRPIPELASSNFMQRSFGERVAMNAPIQGSAADIMKIAMIRVYDALNKEHLKSRLLLQVHDELLVEVYKEELEVVKKIVIENMRHAANLRVLLEVDAHVGNDWYEAK